MEAHKYENGPTCVAFEYETGNPDINIARVEISGRYPETGYAANTAVTELVYVESGTGMVTVEDKHTTLNKGDVVLIEKGEQVYWEGTLTLIIACTPAWYPEQYENT